MADEDSVSVTPRSGSSSNTPSSKSKTNLITRLGGVNRKKSRASEERSVASNRSSGPLRSLTIPEHGLDNSSAHYNSLARSSPRLVEASVATVYCDTRPASPVASLSGGYSNRDSMISSGSNHSDREPASVSSLALASGPPPPLLPPKHGIGREGSEGLESNNGTEQ